jgi:hypothetical protein
MDLKRLFASYSQGEVELNGLPPTSNRCSVNGFDSNDPFVGLKIRTVDELRARRPLNRLPLIRGRRKMPYVDKLEELGWRPRTSIQDGFSRAGRT